MKSKLKRNKLLNIFCSLLIAFAMLVGSNFSCLYFAVNEIRLTSFAKYEPTDFVTPYEFTSATGFSSYTINSQDVRNAFTVSSSLDLIRLENDAYKPQTKYDGTVTNIPDGEDQSSETDNYVMMLRAENAPTRVTVNKTDENGKTVYKTDEQGNFVFEKDESTGKNKIYTSNEGNTDLYVAVNGATDQFYKKIPVTEEQNVYYYYRTTSSLSLRADNWYVVTAWVYTQDASASIIISGTNFEAKLSNVNTNGQWKQYYIFLETSSDSTNSVNIAFYYGDDEGIVSDPETTSETSGVVYLDNLCVKTISETDYNNKTIGGESNEQADIMTYSARYNYDISGVNGNFEEELNLYQTMYGEDGYDKALADQSFQYYINKYTNDDADEKLTERQLANLHRAYRDRLNASIVLESEEFETEEDILDDSNNPTGETQIVPGPSTFNQNNHALKIENKSESYSLGLLTVPITISQFTYYRFSIYIKGTSSSDSATIKLISNILTGANSEEGELQVSSQTVTAYSSSSDITNNWTEVSFYIQGSSYYDMTLQVALLADSESTVYFDNMRLESITSSTYSSASSSKKFDLFPSATTISGSITNGYFNYITTSNVDPNENETPYTPASWTKVDDSSEDVVSGIVSTKDSFYNSVMSKIGGAENPITSANVSGPGGSAVIALPKTNVLAIYSPSQVDSEPATHNYGYTSTDFSLSSSSVYKITFEFYAATTDDANFSGNVYANLIYSDGNVAEIVEEVSSTDVIRGSWQKYTIVVRTGTTSRTCKIEIGVTDANGTVFFQKVGYTRLSSKTVDDETITVDDQYNELIEKYNTVALQNENNIRFVDFDGNSFVMHSQDKVEGKDYYSSLSHSLIEADEDEDPIIQGELGVVDTSLSLTLSSDPAYNLDSAFLTNPKSNSNFALLIYNSENYNTVVNPNSTITLSSSSYYMITVYVKTDKIPEGSGLTINMDKISVTFNNINTETNDYGDLTDSNGYKQFTVFVRTGSSSISGLNISYELGTEKNKTTGTALISGLQVTKFDNETAYTEAFNEYDITDPTVAVKNFAATAESSGDDDANNLTLATFFLVFSSILLVGALVFAIVAIYIKRAPKNRLASGTNNANVSKNKDSDNAPKDGFV